MVFLKKYGFHLLVLVVISELALPFIFASFYPEYSQTSMLISAFGEIHSPVRVAFKIWQITDGILFILTVPAFYNRFKATSSKQSFWLSLMIAAYGIGDCIITGLFDRSSQTIRFDPEEMLHDYASGAGFIALLVGTFLLIRLYSLENRTSLVKSLWLIFLLSSIFMLLFALPRIPIIDQLHLPYRGLWQRANLLFLYLPFLITALQTIFSQNKKTG